jgi:hypothetical protein
MSYTYDGSYFIAAKLKKIRGIVENRIQALELEKTKTTNAKDIDSRLDELIKLLPQIV